MGYWFFWYGGWIGPEIALPQWKWPRWRNPLRNPVVKTDVEALLFAAKSFVAALLAYYVALRIGLRRIRILGREPARRNSGGELPVRFRASITTKGTLVQAGGNGLGTGRSVEPYADL